MEPEKDALAAITAICGELFETDGISGEDNFFMLGGTSLTVLELADRLLERFSLQVALDWIFTADTLADLATHCRPALTT